jgi:UDP-4-amino-4,6-dideoxy-N-acetyl-beta-L-altrosamine N-acetyltransferase
MYNDHLISEAEHAAWLERLRGSDRNRVYVIFRQGAPLGVVSLANIETRHGRADWAFYLIREARGGGIGPRVELWLLRHVFDEMGLEKLNSEVLETNAGVIRLHEKFGFMREGVRRLNIVKDGERVDVCLLGMSRSEWLNPPDTVRQFRERLA